MNFVMSSRPLILISNNQLFASFNCNYSCAYVSAVFVSERAEAMLSGQHSETGENQEITQAFDKKLLF